MTNSASFLESSGRKYTEPMKTKLAGAMPGVEYLIDGRGQRTAAVISLKKHRILWEDMFDAYLAARSARKELDKCHENAILPD